MFRLSRLVGLTLLLALVGQAASFLNFKNAPPPPPLQRVAPLQPPQGDGAVSRPQQPPSRRAQLWALEAEPAEPNMMEEGIYNFNKLVIDSVYDLICLLYNKNDLSKNSIAECTARFYVLETVARVPYFAYLSVMVIGFHRLPFSSPQAPRPQSSLSSSLFLPNDVVASLAIPPTPRTGKNSTPRISRLSRAR